MLGICAGWLARHGVVRPWRQGTPLKLRGPWLSTWLGGFQGACAVVQAPCLRARWAGAVHIGAVSGASSQRQPDGIAGPPRSAPWWLRYSNTRQVPRVGRDLRPGFLVMAALLTLTPGMPASSGLQLSDLVARLPLAWAARANAATPRHAQAFMRSPAKLTGR